MHDKILIVDFGSQVTQLIARCVREEGVYSEIVPFQQAEQAFFAMRPKGVILSGGPASVLDQDAPLAPERIYRAGVPALGICYAEPARAQRSRRTARRCCAISCAKSPAPAATGPCAPSRTRRLQRSASRWAGTG